MPGPEVSAGARSVLAELRARRAAERGGEGRSKKGQRSIDRVRIIIIEVRI